MRTNIPQFRLPPKILDEEIGYVVDMGVDVKMNHRVDSMRALLEEGFDAVFVGSGAPRGKNLEIPGRYDSENIHIGIGGISRFHCCNAPTSPYMPACDLIRYLTLA